MIIEIESLRERVANKQDGIRREIARLGADGSSAARDRIAELEFELGQVQGIVQGNWAQVTQADVAALDEWLKRH